MAHGTSKVILLQLRQVLSICRIGHVQEMQLYGAPNKALHRTLANVAKISDYNHRGRVVVDMLWSWSAGEFGR